MKEVIAYQPELDAIDWRTSVRRARSAVMGHVPLILTSCVVAFVLLFLYIRIFPPVYRAEATLMVESKDDIARGAYYDTWNVFRKWDMRSEPELITSGRVTKQVVDTLGLKFKDVHHTFFTHVGYLWTDSWLGKSWRAFKQWLFPPDPSAYKATPEEEERARTIDAFRDGVTIDVIPGTHVGKIIVRAPSYRAAEIANKVLDVYLAERVTMLRGEADEAYRSLAVEVDNAAKALAVIDKEKLEFDSKNRIVLGFEKDRLEVANWSALQNSIKEISGNLASIEAGLAVVEQQLLSEPPEIVSGRSLQDSKAKGLLQAREVDLRNLLLQASQKYAPNSPEVTELQKLLDETRAMLMQQPDKVVVGEDRIVNPVYTELRQKQNSLRAQLASARASLETKHAPLAAYEKRMAEVPGLTIAAVEHARTRDNLEMRHKLLTQRMMQAEISRTAIGSAPPSVQVIDYASTPMKPIWPRNIILLPSTLAAGLFVGAVLALLSEVFSPRVNRDRLTAHPEVPVYAVIDLRPVAVAALPGPGAAEPPTAVQRLRRLN